MEGENLSKNITHLSCVTASTASGDVEDTEKDICSSSRLCKSVGDFFHGKNWFGKSNHALLLPAEEVYGSPLWRSELFPHLHCRPCKRRLINFIALQTLISESQIS